MKKVNFKKVVFGVSLGTVMAIGSMSSAFAADINQPSAQAKKVAAQLQNQTKPLTQEQAKAEALKKYQGTVKDVKLNKENGKDVYVIVIIGQDGKEHNVKMDAASGATVDFTQEQAKEIALKQHQGTVKDIKLSKENGKDIYVTVIQGQDGKEHNVKVDAATGENVNLTQEQAKEIALKQYPGTVKDIKLNKENGKDVYVIVILGQDGKEHTVKLDAVTGENVSFTQEQAKEIALKQQQGTVKDIKLSKENGKDVYVTVVHGQDGKDHNVKIDAATGENVNFTQEQAKEIALKQQQGTVKDIKLSKENGIDVYVTVIHGQDGKDHNVKIDAKTGEIR